MSDHTQPISPYADVLDSRDIIARIEDLHARQDTLSDDEGAELDALLSLAEDASESPNWEDGATLISNHYFQEYAMDIAEEAGSIRYPLYWPHSCIDWDRAAEELQMDYIDVSYKGQTYWIHG